MDKDQRQKLRAAAEEVAEWVEQARTAGARREQVEKAGRDAFVSIRRRVIEVLAAEGLAWRVIPVHSDDGRNLAAIAQQTHLPAISPIDQLMLDELTSAAPHALRDFKTVSGVRRVFASSNKRSAGNAAADFLVAYRERALSAGLPALLGRLSRGTDHPPGQLPLEEALAPWVGLRARLDDLGTDLEILPASVVGTLRYSIDAIDGAFRREREFHDRSRAAGEDVRKSEVRALISEMPVERLKDATRDRLRTGPLTEAGIATVSGVMDRAVDLERLPGIGVTSAARIRGAAQTLWQTTYDETPVRVDIKAKTAEATELLRCLAAWEAVRGIKSALSDLALKDAVAPLAKAVDQTVTHVIVSPAMRTVSQLQEATQSLKLRANSLPDTRWKTTATATWDDFFSRPADYFALLAELGFLAENEEKAHGDLPDDIIEAVRALELNTQHLTASLRGYQSFAARFALSQRKVIIGDEMGLGKTVEAIAVLAHLRAKGVHHALVICPAAVVTNWMRELGSKSALKPHRVHGPGREAALRSWSRNGGVAVTTFDGVDYLERNASSADGLADLGCVVIDEAHYIKNPAAKRSKRASRFTVDADYAILLTGTPMENRIQEFRNLVSYLRPDLLVDADELAPKRFRRQVAPAYLRRNQEDVLTELPELVEVDEWLPMSRGDSSAYREAVSSGNFMAMRQAALVGSHDSVKLEKLVDIVGEAEESGRRVIVFSHFREVLERVAVALPGRVFGPLTGSVPAAARQTMVDRFSAAGHGAVLVSQIVAGGVGLNVQSASVVVICEPQLKPTIEWQAIARARRMGQLQSVQVHRLLSEEGVDRRITEILARKSALFNDFARVSETAGSAPEAFDVSEAELAREVVAAERQRLFAQKTVTTHSSEAV